MSEHDSPNVLVAEQSPRVWRRWWFWVLVAFGILVVAAGLGFVIWAETPLGPMPQAVAALKSDQEVTVVEDETIVFSPAQKAATVGLVFYPGARIDPASYAPAMRTLAVQGFLAVVTPMPLNLAVLDSDRALSVVEKFPEIRHWAVGGHSLGGAMCADFVASHPEVMDGLLLWAAYPPSGSDLSTWNGRVTSISATQDGLTTPEDIVRTTPLLPAHTEFVIIVGGNHAQFGWYGEQSGDGTASIGREPQQDQIVTATLTLLRSLEHLEP